MQALGNTGTPIDLDIVVTAGKAMIRAHDRTLLAEQDGHTEITKSWILSLLKRMGYVKFKATTK